MSGHSPDDSGAGDPFGHGGEVDGHSATLSFFPGKGLGFVVLANLGGDAAESIARAALPALLKDLAGSSRKPRRGR